tara:strand:+ start:435 stop:674 length:240 start_codon:yes stop_codon:yes gene_type:complete
MQPNVHPCFFFQSHEHFLARDVARASPVRTGHVLPSAISFTYLASLTLSAAISAGVLVAAGVVTLAYLSAVLAAGCGVA